MSVSDVGLQPHHMRGASVTTPRLMTQSPEGEVDMYLLCGCVLIPDSFFKARVPKQGSVTSLLS